MIGDSNVVLYKTYESRYPHNEDDFRPDTKYPECPYTEISKTKNCVYEAVRNTLFLMGLDKEHSDTDKWNPFVDIIKPGMNVLIKPNMVIEENKEGFGTECLYTHPSVIAPIIDYIILATNGNVSIIIGDAPVQECNFKRLIKESGYEKLVAFYQKKNIEIRLVDFRGLTSFVKDGIYNSEINTNAKGCLVDLGDKSEFSILPEFLKKKLRVTNYNPENIIPHHTGQTNEYLISEYVLNSDIIINVPKPKTHRIAGMTASLKNFVGANVRKEFLPHHIAGEHRKGGDESDESGVLLKGRSYYLDKKNYFQDNNQLVKSRLSLFAVRLFSFLMKSRYRDGCWYGNNTISKTVIDINKIIYYADKKGILRNEQQREVIILADMIVAGEGNGPLTPSPKDTGCILLGTNPVCVDETISWMMGFDKNKIPTLVNARHTHDGKFPLINKDVQANILSNISAINKKNLSELPDRMFRFVPSDGWKGHIEREE